MDHLKAHFYSKLELVMISYPCSIFLAIHLCTYTCRTNHQGCSHMWLRSRTRCERTDLVLGSFLLVVRSVN